MTTGNEMDRRSQPGTPDEASSPPSYENWRAQIEGQPSEAAYEYPLFTDAYITGEISAGYGPLEFINTVPSVTNEGEIRPSIVLRLDWHLPNSTNYGLVDSTDAGYYHGGWLTDEIAALASLALGIRLKAGGLTRRFEVGDVRGRPVAWELDRDPFLSQVPRRPIVPRATGKHSLTSLEPLKLYPTLSRSAAIALLRAARLYQDALWIAESEPSLSWVMLVSAIETAANYWRADKESPVARLRASMPALADELDQTGIEDLTERVAERIAPTLGATKKFTDFLMEFLPEPPCLRPEAWGQITWEPAELKKAMRKIYSYRSNALHGGTPFPFPMLRVPYVHQGWAAPAEKPMGLGASAQGGTWVVDDTPMLLHTFEYIVRKALLKWWEQLKD